MPFASIIQVSHRTLADLDAVAAAVGAARPEGLLARIVGASEQALHIVDVWQLQAQHDRFVVERLHPRLPRWSNRLDPQLEYIAFPVVDLYVRHRRPEEAA